MKKVEKESLFKSFLLFFTIQAVLISALFILYYNKEIQTLDASIFSKMRLCSYSLQCSEFQLDFVEQNEKIDLYKLYKNKERLSTYFSIPKSTRYYLQIYLQRDKYAQQIFTIQKNLAVAFSIVMGIVAAFSLLFALYALSPLRKALHLTQEFIKDILHDFNTPLATLRLNVSMLQRDAQNKQKIQRIENSVQTILDLQANLRAYLHAYETQNEYFELQTLIQNRVDLIASNYPYISFFVDVPPIRLYTNKDALTRIIDNLLSNAAKYNNQNGKVYIKRNDTLLLIQDTGKGIHNPHRVFERFYKEQDRGIGIGLHIVKKLCDELHIDISLKSEIGQGSTFYIDLAKLLANK